MTVCRVCGAACEPGELLAVHEGGGCVNCNGSPACSRCGHARRHHRGTFAAREHRCAARVTGEGLVVGRCGCAGYTTERASFGDPVELVEPVELRLRGPGERADVTPSLPPLRDLFDEGRRLLGSEEAVPWRPPR